MDSQHESLSETVGKLGRGQCTDFVSLTELPEQMIFTVTDIVKRYKEEEGSQFNSIHLILDNNIETNLPQHVTDVLLSLDDEDFEKFKALHKFFKFEGMNGPSAMVLFPQLQAKNGCICEAYRECKCWGSEETEVCPCYVRHRINNCALFQGVIHQQIEETFNTTNTHTINESLKSLKMI